MKIYLTLDKREKIEKIIKCYSQCLNMLYKFRFASVETFGRIGCPDACACEPFLAPTRGSRRPECHQHREEGEGAADVQPVPGEGGDTEAR